MEGRKDCRRIFFFLPLPSPGRAQHYPSPHPPLFSFLLSRYWNQVKNGTVGTAARRFLFLFFPPPLLPPSFFLPWERERGRDASFSSPLSLLLPLSFFSPPLWRKGGKERSVVLFFSPFLSPLFPPLVVVAVPYLFPSCEEGNFTLHSPFREEGKEKWFRLFLFFFFFSSLLATVAAGRRNRYFLPQRG